MRNINDVRSGIELAMLDLMEHIATLLGQCMVNDSPAERKKILKGYIETVTKYYQEIIKICGDCK